MKALGFAVVLVVAARMHVTVWLAGWPVSVPVLWFAVPAVTVPATAAVWFAWSAPRRGWPRLIWRAVAA